MSSLLRPSALFIVLCVGVAHADELDQARASAALTLAKVQRERVKATTATPPQCHTDAKAAQAEAKKTGKRLYLFVGMKCEDRPELAVELRKDGVLCHLDSQNGDATPRVSVVGKDGYEYYVRREKIADDAAQRLRKAYEKSDPNPPRKDVGIAEEVRHSPRITYAAPVPVVAPRSVAQVFPTTPGTIARPVVPVNTLSRGGIPTAPTGTYAPVVAPAGGTSRQWGFQLRGPFGGGFSAGGCTTSG